jgi:hypothetical protein
MSSTNTKAETARRNGALSHGPVTPEGKAKSSRNATKHGIYSKIIVTTAEDEEIFAETLDEYRTEYEPVGPVERDLVDDIVGARWRLLRLQIWETAALDHEMDNIEPGLRAAIAPGYTLDNGTLGAVVFENLTGGRTTALSQVSRFQARLERTIHRSMLALERIQDRRAKREKNGDDRGPVGPQPTPIRPPQATTTIEPEPQSAPATRTEPTPIRPPQPRQPGKIIVFAKTNQQKPAPSVIRFTKPDRPRAMAA